MVDILVSAYAEWILVGTVRELPISDFFHHWRGVD